MLEVWRWELQWRMRSTALGTAQCQDADVIYMCMYRLRNMNSLHLQAIISVNEHWESCADHHQSSNYQQIIVSKQCYNEIITHTSIQWTVWYLLSPLNLIAGLKGTWNWKRLAFTIFDSSFSPGNKSSCPSSCLRCTYFTIKIMVLILGQTCPRSHSCTLKCKYQSRPPRAHSDREVWSQQVIVLGYSMREFPSAHSYMHTVDLLLLVVISSEYCVFGGFY